MDVEKLPSYRYEKNKNKKYWGEVLYEIFMEFFDTFWLPRNLSEFLTWSFNGFPFGPWYIEQKNTTENQNNWILCEYDELYTSSVCGNFTIENGSYFLENVEYSVNTFDLEIVNAKHEFILSITLFLGTKNVIINLDFKLVKFSIFKGIIKFGVTPFRFGYRL